MTAAAASKDATTIPKQRLVIENIMLTVLREAYLTVLHDEKRKLKSAG
jgi:hypothetical protein